MSWMELQTFKPTSYSSRAEATAKEKVNGGERDSKPLHIKPVPGPKRRRGKPELT